MYRFVLQIDNAWSLGPILPSLQTRSSFISIICKCEMQPTYHSATLQFSYHTLPPHPVVGTFRPFTYSSYEPHFLHAVFVFHMFIALVALKKNRYCSRP